MTIVKNRKKIKEKMVLMTGTLMAGALLSPSLQAAPVAKKTTNLKKSTTTSSLKKATTSKKLTPTTSLKSPFSKKSFQVSEIIRGSKIVNYDIEKLVDLIADKIDTGQYTQTDVAQGLDMVSQFSATSGGMMSTDDLKELAGVNNWSGSNCWGDGDGGGGNGGACGNGCDGDSGGNCGISCDGCKKDCLPDSVFVGDFLNDMHGTDQYTQTLIQFHTITIFNQLIPYFK